MAIWLSGRITKRKVNILLVAKMPHHSFSNKEKLF
jgi:hypothetical protein